MKKRIFLYVEEHDYWSEFDEKNQCWGEISQREISKAIRNKEVNMDYFDASWPWRKK
ncbi:MAG: hypothetical protein LBF00_01865 [Mycoplasmataceae bacterium]|jgi:hypothetical protein|nr:hypothetical protein [Mycoplasmataceae bacterium]